MKLYFIRHGESVANVARYMSGNTDVPLTEKGLRQAKEVAEKLKDIKFSAVYSSELQRARHTAGAILEGRDLELISLRDLGERDFGEWEGLTFDEIKVKFADDWNDFIKEGFNAVIPGGERMESFFERVLKAFQNVIARHDVHSDESICIVVHGCVLMALFSYFSHGDLRGYNKYLFENARVNMVQYNSDYSVICKLNA